MIMPFGKYRGKPIAEIPADYLEWVLANCSSITPTLRDAIAQAMEPSTTIAEPVASKWYRRLAAEFHPDKGGSHEAMIAVNRGRDLLLEMMEEVA